MTHMRTARALIINPAKVRGGTCESSLCEFGTIITRLSKLCHMKRIDYYFYLLEKYHFLPGGEGILEMGGGGGEGDQLLFLDHKGEMLTYNIFFSEEGIKRISNRKRTFMKNLFYWKMDYEKCICHKIIRKCKIFCLFAAILILKDFLNSVPLNSFVYMST